VVSKITIHNEQKKLYLSVPGRHRLGYPHGKLPATQQRHCPFHKKQKLGVALVGLGYYSTDLLVPALQLTEHCNLAGIVTGTPEKAASWKKQYNLKDQNICIQKWMKP